MRLFEAFITILRRSMQMLISGPNKDNPRGGDELDFSRTCSNLNKYVLNMKTMRCESTTKIYDKFKQANKQKKKVKQPSHKHTIILKWFGATSTPMSTLQVPLRNSL